MDEKTYEEVLYYITLYRETLDDNVLSKLIDLHKKQIDEYIEKCSYTELSKEEIYSILISNIIEIIKYYNIKSYELYRKNLKDSMKKKVYTEVKKIRISNGLNNSSVNIEKLTEKEQFIINATHGINGYEKQTPEEISKSLNISPDRVKVLEQVIRKKLHNQ